MKEAQEAHEKRVNAGKMGGKAKASNAKAMPEQSSSNHNHIDTKVSNTPISPNPKDQRFNEFWDLYPRQRRGSKDKALIAYRGALKRGNTEQQIIDGVKTYASSSDVTRGYAKGCAAWLNDDGFNNQYQPMGNSQASSPGKRSEFDALATAAAKIQEDVEGQELDYIRRTDPNLYIQRLLDQSRRADSAPGGSDAPDTIEHNSALLDISYSEGGSTDR